MRSWGRVYLVLTCTMLFAGILAFGLGCWRAIQAPYEIDYGEGIVMWQAAHVTDLKTAFRPIEEYPHIVFHYTPLYQLATHLAEPLARDLLAAGRWVSFLSALCVLALIGFQTWLAIPARFAPWLRGGTALLAASIGANLGTMTWARLARVDMLGLAFTFAGLVLFLGGRWRGVVHYLAFLSFVLAIYTKQTNIAAPAACLVVALWVDWRHALRLLGFAVLVGGAALGILAGATHGNVVRHWFLYNQNPFSVINMLGIVQLNIASIAPLAALSFALLACAALWLPPRWDLRRSRTRLAIALACIHLIFALGMSLSCGKRGSNYNYFLEWNLACCLPVGLILAFVLHRSVKANRRPQIAEAAVLALLLVFASNGVASFAESLRPRAAEAQLEKDTVELIEAVRRYPGPVYSENMSVLLKAGKEIPAEPSIVTNLAQTGRWDERPFVQKISNGYFSAIVVTTSLDNRNRFTDDVSAAIRQAYVFDRTLGSASFYVPKAAASQPMRP